MRCLINIEIILNKINLKSTEDIMGSIGTEFARQIILVLFYVFLIVVAVRLGISLRKKKNDEAALKNKE